MLSLGIKKLVKLGDNYHLLDKVDIKQNDWFHHTYRKEITKCTGVRENGDIEFFNGLITSSYPKSALIEHISKVIGSTEILNDDIINLDPSKFVEEIEKLRVGRLYSTEELYSLLEKYNKEISNSSDLKSDEFIKQFIKNYDKTEWHVELVKYVTCSLSKCKNGSFRNHRHPCRIECQSPMTVTGIKRFIE